ncbi:MAG: hypothetical protein ACLQFX_06425 [Acidimicrobiales bacterium]
MHPVIPLETLRETRHEADLFGRVIAMQKTSRQGSRTTTSGP